MHHTGRFFRTGRNLIEKYINNRMRIPRLKGMRTDVGVNIRRGAGAVVGEAREFMAVDQLEVVLDGVLARSGVGPEPGLVSVCAARNTLEVRMGPAGVGLGAGGGGVELRLSDR